MNVDDYAKAQGHWILAKMGKKVLRPGGKALTQKLVSGLDIRQEDEIVEFAPGIGYTAGLALQKQPKSYVGVDADEEVVSSLQQKIKGKNIQFQLGNAAHTQIADASKDKVYGEAMLTMHADHRKSEIIKEAHRILKKGGLYAIHELGLVHINEAQKNQIQKDLALTIKVNARPLTNEEWTKLLVEEGFKVNKIFTNEMALLETKRIIDDEGFWSAMKIGYNIVKNKAARSRILDMRRTFRKYQDQMNSIVIIAEKI